MSHQMFFHAEADPLQVKPIFQSSHLNTTTDIRTVTKSLTFVCPFAALDPQSILAFLLLSLPKTLIVRPDI